MQTSKINKGLFPKAKTENAAEPVIKNLLKL